MTKLLRTLLALVALIAIVAFAVANRTPVPVSFAPLPILMELPVYGVFLLGLVLGSLIGGLALWLSGIPQRFRARRMRKRVSALENQVAVLQKREQRALAESYPQQREMIAAGTSR
jgi:lipopolysaccharide assembly protein A